MAFNVTTKRIRLSANERVHIVEVSGQLQNYFRAIVDIRWTLSSLRQNKTAKCRLHARSGYYRAEASTDDILRSVNMVREKLTKQRRRKKAIRKKVMARRRQEMHNV